MRYLPLLLVPAAAVLISAADPGQSPLSQGAAAPAPHHFCGWLYGSRDAGTRDRAYDTFAAHAEDLDAVHPTWWHVTGTTTLSARAPGFEDPRVMANTRAAGGHALLIPTIQAEDAPDRDFAHAIINDPDLRRRHAADITRLVVERGYDGIDLDYEHLGETLGPGQTAQTEARAFSAFIAEAGAALRAAGKTLSVAVPAEEGPGGIYDYEALSAAADHVHVMGYDYHYEDGPHAGPVAPLGWIEGVVRYIGTIDGGRRRDRFILGMPNYGLVGPSVTVCAPSTRCLEMAGASYPTVTDHMEGCSMGAEPALGRSPNQALPGGGQVFFDDIDSLEEKVEAAARGGLGGVSYWSIGGEPDRPGPRTFFQMVRAHFPR